MNPPVSSLDPAVAQPLARLLLAAADDKLILGHRNGDWTGLGPILEEDIAFSNIAQDEIAHAQELYRLAAALLEPQADPTVAANRLAYARGPAERLCAELVVIPDEFDWASAVARQFFFDHFDAVRLPRMQRGSYAPLAELAGKMHLEIGLHLRHFDEWIRRLGHGTAESRTRIIAALAKLWPYALGLFEALDGQERLAGAGIDPGTDAAAEAEWRAQVAAVIKSAGLPPLDDTAAPRLGGRQGRHSPALAELLNELGEVYRLEPDAAW